MTVDLKIQELEKKKTGELTEKNKQLQAAQTKLQQGGTVLSDSARSQLEKEIEKMNRDIQFFQQDAQTEGQELQNQLQQEFQDKIGRLEKQLSQVKIKEAQAEAATALSSVAFKVGDLVDTMKTVEDVLQKRYEVSAGKARVARDIVDVGKVQEKLGTKSAAADEL